MIVVFWQTRTDIKEDAAAAVNKRCHDVGLRKQHLGYHNSCDCWCFILLYGFVCYTVLMLAVLIDSRWKLAATYCNTIRCHHMAWCCRKTGDILHSAECQPAALQHITVTVDSKCLHYMTLHWKFCQSVCCRILCFHAKICVQGQPLTIGSTQWSCRTFVLLKLVQGVPNCKELNDAIQLYTGIILDST